MMMCMMLCTTINCLFICLKHPLSVGIALMAQTTLISMTTGVLFSNYWMSYILFLIFLGGLLVIIIYMTSLASNEKFKFSLTTISLLTSCMLIMMIGVYLAYYYDYSYWLNFNSGFPCSNCATSHKILWKVLKIYFLNNAYITLFLSFYLFLSLVITVHLTKKFKGSLRCFHSYV